MQMNDEFGSGGSEMTDTWTCFGDPSLMVRTAMPQAMTVTHDPVLLLGISELTVLCSAEGARATLSLDGTRLSTGVVQGGSVTLEFDALSDVGMANLTITAFNHLPYLADIEIIPATGPYVVLESYQIVDEAGNNNGLADYNESISLTVGLENVGIEDATNVMVTLTTDDPYITLTDQSELFLLIPAGETIDIENAFAFLISSDIPDQHAVTFSLSASDADNTWESVFIITANAPILHINSIAVNDTEAGNGDGELDPGESADLTINYSNTGHAVAYDVDVYLEGQSGFVELSDPLQNFSSIGMFDVYDKTFTAAVDGDAPEGIKIDFVNELTMGDFMMNRVFPLKVSAKCEDFETGDFSLFDWQSGGNLPWQIIQTYPYEGNYSIRSGGITHSQTSEISLNYDVLAPDSIVFIRKVSSESSDFLKFYINDQLIQAWSGTTGAWNRAAFAVEAGNNTFKWVYEKNAIGSAGSDCAWLDFIVLPAPLVLTIWAGPDDKICTGESYQLGESYGTDYNQILWTSSGNGTFDDNTSMHPVYNPGSEDFNAGQAMLTLALWDGQGNTAADEMMLELKPLTPAPGIPQGPVYINLTEIQVSEYFIDGLEEAEDYNWYLEPAEAGEIIADLTNATVNWDLDFLGYAYISVAGINECGVGIISDALTIVVENTLVGIPESGNGDFSMVVYPNPVNEILNITFAGENVKNVEIRLVNMIGEMVTSTRSSLPGRATVEIPVSHLSPGIYMLIADNEGQRIARKVVIK
jgi:hypothetical protein